jgi:addiction module HigA family antidote
MVTIRFPHPGEILNNEFLVPMDISAHRLAKAIDVPQSRISAILGGDQAITKEAGLRLSKFFGLTEGFWIGLQVDYDVSRSRPRI